MPIHDWTRVGTGLVHAFCIVALCALAAGRTTAQEGFKTDLDLVARQGTGTQDGRAAWGRLAHGGPETLVPMLREMNGRDTVACNWLRTALDGIVAKTPPARLPLDELLAFAQEPRNEGRARRLALDLVDEHRPGTMERMLADALEDHEFRYDAVKGALQRAQSFIKKGAKAEAEQLFRKALGAAREIDQVRAAAAGLAPLGIDVSVARHMGFFRDWYVIGPFDAKGMKGFHLRYPPEDKVDLEAELDGQNGKVRWKRYTAPETNSGTHQALVNLRDRVTALGDADDAVAFAYTAFEVDAPLQAEFRGAADDNFTVYFNGDRVFGFEEYRNGVRHDRHRFPVRLKAGKNTVLVKICQTPAPNPEPNWEFFLRAVDSTGKGIAVRTLLP
jgi:hypothetical protein